MGRRVWMTRQMIVDKYKSESVADRIITNKLSNEDTKKSQTKAHPDDPDNEELRLYLIWDTEQEETTEDTILMQLFSAVDKDDDSQEANQDKKKRKCEEKKKGKKRGKSSSSSSQDCMQSLSEFGQGFFVHSISTRFKFRRR
ncbi:unnamed protein product [Symbiodinium microadriaticum]|nr:unnamed protein product [Symbiodinium microadriaticum]